jgi:hypothetical protein
MYGRRRRKYWRSAIDLGGDLDQLPEHDRIEVDGQPLARVQSAHRYVALYKPR